MEAKMSNESSCSTTITITTKYAVGDDLYFVGHYLQNPQKAIESHSVANATVYLAKLPINKIEIGVSILKEKSYTFVKYRLEGTETQYDNGPFFAENGIDDDFCLPSVFSTLENAQFAVNSWRKRKE